MSLLDEVLELVKDSISPVAAVLMAHTRPRTKSILTILSAATILDMFTDKKYSIDQLKIVLHEYGLDFISTSPQALSNLYTNLLKVSKEE